MKIIYNKFTVLVSLPNAQLVWCKEIQPVYPKGDQSWVFIGRIDVEAETPTLWPPDVKSWIIGKDPDAGKDWRQEEKRAAEDEKRLLTQWMNKILKEMGVPDHLTCLLRNLYVGQEATIKTGHGTTMDSEHEFEQTLGDGGGQRSLACYSPWGRKASDTTEQPNNNN